jgi:hypothetical protein
LFSQRGGEGGEAKESDNKKGLGLFEFNPGRLGDTKIFSAPVEAGSLNPPFLFPVGDSFVYKLVANPLHPFYVTSQVLMALSLTFSLFFAADLVVRRLIAIIKLFNDSLVGC